MINMTINQSYTYILINEDFIIKFFCRITDRLLIFLQQSSKEHTIANFGKTSYK